MLALYEFESRRPVIGKTSCVPESANIILVGDWAIVHGAMIRGAVPDGKIAVGLSQ